MRAGVAWAGLQADGRGLRVRVRQEETAKPRPNGRCGRVRMAQRRFICAVAEASGSNMGRGTDVRALARAARSFHCKKPKRVLASNYP